MEGIEQTASSGPLLSARAAAALSVLATAAAVAFDLVVPQEVVPSILYAVPVLLSVWTGSRRWLWGLASAAAILTVLAQFAGPPASIRGTETLSLVNRVLVALTVVAVAGLVDLRITALREIAAAHRAERDRLHEAEEASRRKSRFIAAVSHDVRAKTSALIMGAELVERLVAAGRTDAVREEVRTLKSGAGSLVELVRDVMELSVLEHGSAPLHPEEFDLGQAVDMQCRCIRPAAEQKGLELAVELPPGPIRLRTDRVKLGRVLGNLIGNALKFTEAGGISVRLSSDGGGAVLLVSDTGPGIAAEHLPKLFDEFSQFHNREGGAGLGLSICKRLTSALGGSIAVESTVGRGATFTVRLPAFPPGTAEPAVDAAAMGADAAVA